jgi:hypothetical protein
MRPITFTRTPNSVDALCNSNGLARTPAARKRTSADALARHNRSMESFDLPTEPIDVSALIALENQA